VFRRSPTHRDPLGWFALVRGSPFDSVRLSRTSRTCMACRFTGEVIPVNPSRQRFRAFRRSALSASSRIKQNWQYSRCRRRRSPRRWSPALRRACARRSRSRPASRSLARKARGATGRGRQGRPADGPARARPRTAWGCCRCSMAWRLPSALASSSRPPCTLRSARFLAGYRNLPARDVNAAVAAIVGITELAADVGDRIGELDLNPLMLGEAGQEAQPADALVLLSDGR
jgi:hypothetical protein